MNNNEQPGWSPQPDNQPPARPQSPEQGTYPPVPPAPGQWGQPQQFAQASQQHGPEPLADTTLRYGHLPSPEQSGQQYGQAPMFTQPPSRTGMPVWGWIAGGVGAVAVFAVAGVLIFNGLAGTKQPDVLPSPNVTESAATEEALDDESADAVASEDAGGSVYLFNDADFSSAPVWSVREPEGWTKEPVKEGMVNYRNAGLQCTFTIHQAVLTGARGTGDEAATAVAMASEINGVKEAVGRPVDVIDDAGSVYVDLRDGSQDIELQEAELRSRTTTKRTWSTGWRSALQPAAAS